MTAQNFQKIRIGFITFSTILFPVTFYYFSPVIPIGGSTLGIISGSIIMFLLMLITSMVLGRSFCSWMCPAGGIQDQAGLSRTKTVAVRKISWMKYVIWGTWLGMLLFFFRRAGGVKGIDFAFSTEMGLSTTSVQALIAYSMVVIVFFGVSLIFGRRAGCHTLCWMAPFMVIGRKLGFALKVPSLHLSTSRQNCVSCGRCTSACPMSLPVQELVQQGKITDNNCILCGKCMNTCRKDVIAWSWR